MRTTLDLPQALIEEAQKVSHHKTKTSVIVAALQDYVRKGRLAGLKRYRGRVSLKINLSALRDRK